MTNSSAGTAVLALAAGLIGAVTVVMMQSLDEQPGLAEGGVTVQQVSSLQLQLSELLSTQDELLLRLSQLEMDALRGRPNGRPVTPLMDTSESVVALQRQVSRLSDAMAKTDGEGGPGLFTIDDVGTALATLREEEEAERAAQREAMREQRLAERLAAVATELGLDTYQQQKLSDAAALAMEGLDATFRSAREGGDWASLRTTMDTARTAFDDASALFLSPDQQASFAELGGLRSLGGFGPGGFGGGSFGRGRGGDR